MASHRPFKAILIDLYSTLVHEPSAGWFCGLLAEPLGVPVEPFTAAYRARGNDAMHGTIFSMADRVGAACADIGIHHAPTVVANVVDRFMDRWYAAAVPYPDTIEALVNLRTAGFPLALVSNASSYSEQVLDDHDLRGLFDKIVLSYAVGVMKPAAEIYLIACEQLGVMPQDCLFVGDGGHDELAGAASLNMTTVHVRHPEKPSSPVANTAIETFGNLPLVLSTSFTS